MSGAENCFISKHQAEHLGDKTIMSLHQRGLEAGDNFTKSTSWSKYKLSRNQIISKSFPIIYSILNHSCAYKQIIESHYWGARMAQSVKRQTLDFSSGGDLAVRGFEPCTGLCTDSAEPAWESLSPPLCAPLQHSLSLSKINFKKKKKKKQQEYSH